MHFYFGIQNILDIFVIENKTIMTAKEIYQAYCKQYSYMPITEDKVELFLEEYPIFRTCEDLKYLVNMLYNWVGSQEAYEEGAEEEW